MLLVFDQMGEIRVACHRSDVHGRLDAGEFDLRRQDAVQIKDGNVLDCDVGAEFGQHVEELSSGTGMQRALNDEEGAVWISSNGEDFALHGNRALGTGRVVHVDEKGL